MVEFSKQALEPVEQALVATFDGHPHMGKHNTFDCSDLANTYEEFDVWRSVLTEFNAFGTFNNKFTNDKGLDVTNPTDGEPHTDCDP